MKICGEKNGHFFLSWSLASAKRIQFSISSLSLLGLPCLVASAARGAYSIKEERAKKTDRLVDLTSMARMNINAVTESGVYKMVAFLNSQPATNCVSLCGGDKSHKIYTKLIWPFFWRTGRSSHILCVSVGGKPKNLWLFVQRRHTSLVRS